MTRRRREFTQEDRIAIRGRATDSSGNVHCEGCGVWLKRKTDYQIDHVIPEGMRPLADLKRKLRPADGQLLCVAVCHPAKTKDDKGHIGEAKRREAKHPLVAAGKPRIAREYGL
jgi:hypothetical protein